MAKKPKNIQVDRLHAAMVVRNAAMNQLATVLTTIWGARCDRNQAACPSCAAWAIYDAMEKMTDIGHFADLSVEDAMKIIEVGKRNK